MEWRKGRRSDNVVDARGEGGGGGGMRFGGGKGLGLGAILLIVGIGWLTGQDPLQILGQLTGQMEQQQQQTAPSGAGGKAPPANDQQAEFVASVLGDTEDTWKALFAEAGKQYRDPKLVLFSGQVNSACGLPRQRSGRSTARRTSGCTWTCRSSAKWKPASLRPATSPRPT
jgi:predicted metalloprotease